jgi:acetylornithine deacetylase
LEALARELPGRVPPHRLCGDATLSVGTIAGGISVNTVPDRATIEIDRRILPGEDDTAAYRQAIDYVAAWPGIDFPVEHDPPFMRGSTLRDGPNQSLADALVAAARQTLGRCELVGVPFGTDASKIADDGVPAVVFGPGSIEQAHTADEWLDLAQLEQAAAVYYRFAAEGGAQLAAH